MKPAWTQLSWVNEQKVLARTLATLLSEVQAFYVSSGSSSSGVVSASEESFIATAKELDRKRQATVMATRKALGTFKNDIKIIRAKQQLAGANRPSAPDPLQLKELLETFETKLTSYKIAMRRDFDALLGDFVSTEEDLRECLEKSSIAGVGDAGGGAGGGDDSADNITAGAKRVKQDVDKNLQMQTQVAVFDRQIQEMGGRHGHWDPRDHDVFMRVWNQTPAASKSPEASGLLHMPKKRMLCRKLVTLLADRTDVECEEHYDWYVKYTSLLEQKKRLLEEWKGTTEKERERERRAILAGRGAAGGGAEAEDDGSTAASDLHKRYTGPSEVEAQRMREQIERWKKSKADEHESKAQHEREEAMRERQLREDRARKRQQEARLQLEKWKADEAVVKQLENLDVGGAQQGQGSPRRRASVSAAEMEKNAARDLEFAKKRREERETKEKQASARETRIKELEGKIAAAPSASRDPSRLLADTITTGQSRKTAEQLDLEGRRRASSGAHSATIALSARDLGSMRRATPTWIARPQV